MSESTATPPPGFFAGFPFDSAPFALAPIQTERLILRPLAERDIDDVWQYQQLDDVLRFIPWPERSFDEAAEHTRKRASAHELTADGDAVIFAVELPGHPTTAVVELGTAHAADADAEHSGERNRVIGDVMLRVSSVETAEIEIGWVFHPDFEGKGYATEAAEAMLRLAFEDIDAHRVVAHLDPRNEASARLCVRLGLIHEGTTRQSYFDKGEWSDGAIYGLLASEWRTLEDAPAPHTP